MMPRWRISLLAVISLACIANVTAQPSPKPKPSPKGKGKGKGKGEAGPVRLSRPLFAPLSPDPPVPIQEKKGD